MTVAGEALEAAASVKLAPWAAIASARVEGARCGRRRCDGRFRADEPGAHEERARLGLMVPVPTGWLP